MKFQGFPSLNIDLEKQIDVGGCLVCISSDYFSSYKLEPARRTSFLQKFEAAVFQKAERKTGKGNNPTFSVHIQTKCCILLVREG